MSSQHYWYLNEHPLFNVLKSDELKEICFISKYKTARKGEIILFTENNNDRVFTLKKGSLKIVDVDKNGNEIVKDILKKGDMFGELSFTASEQSQYAVVISESAIFCSFVASELERYMVQNPALAMKYTKWVGLWYKRLENRLSNLMFKDVNTRLLLYLKSQIEPTDENLHEVTLPNQITHSDLASLICSTRQTITSLLNQLKSEGVLDYNRKEIVINPKKLQEKMQALDL